MVHASKQYANYKQFYQMLKHKHTKMFLNIPLPPFGL